MNSPSTPLPIIKKSFTTSLLGIMKYPRLYVPSITWFIETSLLDFGLPHLKNLGFKSFNIGFNTRF